MKIGDIYASLVLESDNSKIKRIEYDIPLPHDIYVLNNAFKKYNHELYIVGGSIRDALVGRKPKDWDLATDATPDQVDTILKQIPIVKNIILTGKAFGVMVAITENDEYEIATFRADIGSSDSRRPDSVRFTDIEQDALRRDLTINALYYDIDTHEIIDIVGGMDDIKNGKIRTVGNATQRFEEDRLRILRAIRFAGRFKTELSDDIKESLLNDNNLTGVSVERIRDEFIKGIKTAKDTVYLLNLYQEFDLYQFIFPQLNVSITRAMNSNEYIPVIASLLFTNNTQTTPQILNKLTYSRDEINNIMFLLNLIYFKPEEIKIFKKKQQKISLDETLIIEFCEFNKLNTSLIKTALDYKLQITSKDAFAMGIKPGPEMGSIINKMEINNFKENV